jgi:hypothetical protein
MSFDTTHSGSESDSDTDSDTTTTHGTLSTDEGTRPAIPGSPWRDPIRLEDKVDADVLGQSLRNIARKRIRQPRTEEDAGTVLYVKGSQEVPLESRIESEYEGPDLQS